MTILSGLLTALPTDVLLGSMVIYIDGTAAYGATQGEPVVNLPHEYDNLSFDGKIGIPIVGLDRRMGGTPSIEGTFIELNATKALDLEPGGTSGSSGGVQTITPKLLGEFLGSSDYKQNVRAVCRRGGGGIVAVEFDWALLIIDTITGASAGNGSVKLRFEARQVSDAASLGVAPYSIKLAVDLQTIVTPDP